MSNKKCMLAAAILPGLLLTACGGGNDSETLLSPSFSFAISDAPVDDLSEVVICFNRIELLKSGDDEIFTIGETNSIIAANDLCVTDNDELVPNTVGIDLLKYTGKNSLALMTSVPIAAGEYTQIRLIMSEGSYGTYASTSANFNTTPDNQVKVTVPSNELKLDGFTATLGGVVDFTLEFDLRKGMTNPVGQEQYFLKPRGVRLVNNNQAGHISGTVSGIDQHCAVNQVDTSQAVASVYLYQDAGLEINTLADNGGIESNLPLASTAVYFDGVDQYNFEIGFVQLGSYTIAFSCDTTDDPEFDDDITFIEAQNVTLITSGKTETVEFNF